MASRAHQHAPGAGVTYGVRHQVAERTLDKTAISQGHEPGGKGVDMHPLQSRGRLVHLGDTGDQGAQGQGLEPGLDLPGLQPQVVQHLAEELLGRVEGPAHVTDRSISCRALRALQDLVEEQARSLKRLTQVVRGRGEKACAGIPGGFGGLGGGPAIVDPSLHHFPKQQQRQGEGGDEHHHGDREFVAGEGEHDDDPDGDEGRDEG